MWSFFLKAVIADNAFDATGGNGVAILSQLRCDDIGTGLRVEESCANNQFGHLGGTAVVALWAGLPVDKGLDALLGKSLAHLVVTRFGVGEVLGGLSRSDFSAFALQEHRHFQRCMVVGANRQAALRADEERIFSVVLEHDEPPVII